MGTNQIDKKRWCKLSRQLQYYFSSIRTRQRASSFPPPCQQQHFNVLDPDIRPDPFKFGISIKRVIHSYRGEPWLKFSTQSSSSPSVDVSVSEAEAVHSFEASSHS